MFRSLGGRALVYLLLTPVFGALIIEGFLRLASTATPAGLEDRPGDALNSGQRGMQSAARAATEKPALSANQVVRSTGNGQDILGHLAHLVLGVLEYGLLFALMIGIVLCVTRARARSSRRMRRYRLQLYRNDTATPEQVRAFFQSLGGMFTERWYTRLVYGQPWFGLEAYCFDESAGGGESVRTCALTILAPQRLWASLNGAIAAAYPNVRIGYTFNAGQESAEVGLDPEEVFVPGDWYRHILRLKKKRNVTQAIAVPVEGYTEPAIDQLLSTAMSLSGTPVGVQFSITPMFGLFERIARWMYRQREREEERQAQLLDSDPGLRSGVVQQEFSGGLDVQHQMLFHVDARVFSSTLTTAQTIAGLIAGASGGENRLMIRQPLPLLWLYQRRLPDARPKITVSWLRCVYSSSELAGLWQLPTPHQKNIRVARSNLPRAPAPACMERTTREHGVLEDEHGWVRIAAEDKKYGIGILGSQGTGKTSVIVADLANDAEDSDCACIVFDPKTTLAKYALSVIPEWRTVYFLNLANPDFGMNPLMQPAEPNALAAALVQAFMDVNEDGALMASSRRYLTHAAIAAIAIAKHRAIQPTLWLMFELLMPQASGYHKLAADVCTAEGNKFASTTRFFREHLPGDLKMASTMTATKLDSPKNKLEDFLQPSINRVLHHPTQVTMDQIIEERAVLIVDGAMGTVSQRNCQTMLQILAGMLHNALSRRQELKSAGAISGETVRVAYKGDEAWMYANRTFATMLALHREAGLETCLAWQYMDQIEDEVVREGTTNLLQHRITFRVGSPQDARDMATLAMSAFTDMIRGDEASREQVRFPPDVLLNLDRYFAQASTLAHGARAPSWLGRTKEIEVNERRVTYHLERQLQRPGFGPIEAPAPLGLGTSEEELLVGTAGHTPDPDVQEQSLASEAGLPINGEQHPAGRAPASKPADSPPAAMPTSTPRASEGQQAVEQREQSGDEDAEGTASNTAHVPMPADVFAPSSPAGTVPPDGGSGVPAAAGQARRFHHTPPRDSVDAAPVGSEFREAPQSYTELQFDGKVDPHWDERRQLVKAVEEFGDLDDRALQIMVTLWRLDMLLGSQIAATWWSRADASAARNMLSSMWQQGLLWRFKLRVIGRKGRPANVYVLSDGGYQLLKHRNLVPRRRPKDETSAREWEPTRMKEGNNVRHDLSVNGYLLAMRALAKDRIRQWHGPREAICRLAPPRIRVNYESVPIGPGDVGLPTGFELLGEPAQLARFAQLNADALVEMYIDVPNGPRGARRLVDFFIELDRTRRPSKQYPKFKAYDALISGWSFVHDRYQAMHERPRVIFVCQDEPQAWSFLEHADRDVTGAIHRIGSPLTEAHYFGRENMYFVVERDMHCGSMRALVMPPHPPQLRAQLKEPKSARTGARRVVLLAREHLKRPATS
jgi:Replication-relaxation